MSPYSPAARAHRFRRFLCVSTLASTCALAFAGPPDLGLGRGVFEDGRGRDGRDVSARVAGGTVSMRGAAVACASCHGANGSGGGEGWIDAPDIRGFALSKSYGARRSGGEARPPYDRESFARAVRAGIASDDATLDPAMPRFDLADDEIDGLLAHLNALSDRAHARIEPPALVVLMPRASTPSAERLLQNLQNCPAPPMGLGRDVAETMPALRVLRYDAIEALGPQLDAMARDGSAAAIFAPYLVGAEASFARSGIGRRLPVVLPMTMQNIGVEDRVFFGLPDLSAQAIALIQAPSSPRADRLILAVDPALVGSEALTVRLRETAEAVGWRVRTVESFDAVFDEEGDAALVLTDVNTPPQGLSRPLELWVPVAFAAPSALDAWASRGARVRIAMPYPPTVGDDPRWIPPADAWAAIGCELLAQLSPLPARADDVDAWRRTLERHPELRLGDWLRIPATAEAQPSLRAHVMEWRDPARKR